jgi:ABC-type antimicrobial peptide transport system permease subunit
MAVYIAAAPTSQGVGLRRIVARVDDRFSGSVGPVLAGVRQAMQTAGEGLPFAEVHLVADDPTVRHELRPFRLGATMFGIFGALALVLAAVGTYGVVSYSVAQRTHEMGVRIALGARAFDILGLVMRHGVGLATIGIVLGAGLAMLGGRFIGPLLFQVSPHDPLVGALGILVLLGVATAASLFPAIRAVRVDALIALRAE